jgi:hypothetical protein
MEMTNLSIQDLVTKTAAFTGTGVDVSALTGDWTLKVQVESLTNQKAARLVFEDTVNDFTASVAVAVFAFLGGLEKTYDKVKSFKKADLPGARVGVTNGKMRLNVGLIDGSASVKYRAWIEY